jgi:hypothetical protein
MQRFSIFPWTDIFLWFTPAFAYFNSRRKKTLYKEIQIWSSHYVQIFERIQMNFTLHFSEVCTFSSEFWKFLIRFLIFKSNRQNWKGKSAALGWKRPKGQHHRIGPRPELALGHWAGLTLRPTATPGGSAMALARAALGAAAGRPGAPPAAITLRIGHHQAEGKMARPFCGASPVGENGGGVAGAWFRWG